MNENCNRVTVITVCFNCRDTIEKTIESVIRQDYPVIQYIIIDGGSTDGTLDSVNKYLNKIDLIISEKDSGIYDAMNKGLSHAQGDLIYFINSGDLLGAPDTINRIVTVFKKNPDVSLIHGDAIGYGEMPEEYRSMYRRNPVVYFSQVLCHQTLFARRQVFETVGNFDTRFSIFADRDWLFRCLFDHDEKILHIKMPVCYYLLGGFSSQRDETFFRQRTRLFLKYFFHSRVLVLLIKNPRELILVLVLILYSMVNIISFAVFHRGFLVPRVFQND
jgi:glycosyltransferase involved in cell wall biosynthesis